MKLLAYSTCAQCECRVSISNTMICIAQAITALRCYPLGGETKPIRQQQLEHVHSREDALRVMRERMLEMKTTTLTMQNNSRHRCDHYAGRAKHNDVSGASSHSTQLGRMLSSIAANATIRSARSRSLWFRDALAVHHRHECHAAKTVSFPLKPAKTYFVSVVMRIVHARTLAVPSNDRL